MRSFFNFLTKPYGMYLVTSFLSIVAWSIPLSGGIFIKGYSNPRELFTPDLLYILLWTSIIFSSSFFSYQLGIQFSSIFSYSKKINEGMYVFQNRGPYYMLSVLGALGTFYTIFSITGSAGLRLIIFSFLTGNGNILNDTLYSNYHIGLYSLRYLSTLSASIGLYKIALRKFSLIDIFNLTMLAINIAISTRLVMIICGIIFFAFLVVDRRVRIRKNLVVGGLAIALIILTVANYARNSNYYKSFGINNPIVMNIAQIDAYLGTPFQGELTTAQVTEMREGLNLPFNTQIHYASIAPNFNTNSAMTYLQIGRAHV